MIYVGQKLKIYTSSPPPKTSSTASTNATANTSTTNTTNTSNQSSSTSTKTQNIVHIVKSGETLSAIASKYGVSVDNIKNWNNLSTDKLSIGQKLKINPTTQTSSKTVTQKMHTVKSGETLSSIANKYNTTVDAIMKANNLKSTKIYVGQKLKIQ
jgi:LysM repeat protein